MKKSFFLFLVLLGSCFIVNGQKTINNVTIISNFDETKSLTENRLVTVVYLDSPNDYYLIPSYRGETKEMFLLRITRSSFVPSLYTTVPKDIIEKKKNLLADKKDPNEMPLMNNSTLGVLIFIFVGVIYGLFKILKNGPKNKSW